MQPSVIKCALWGTAVESLGHIKKITCLATGHLKFLGSGGSFKKNNLCSVHTSAHIHLRWHTGDEGFNSKLCLKDGLSKC